MKTIAVVTFKGGSGKTTVAVNLAVAGYGRGQRVLIADLDPQHSAVMTLKARTVAGPGCLATTGGKLFQLQQTARGAGAGLLVIDTPGNSQADVAEAMRLADLCLVVSRPTFLDLAAALATAEMIRRFDKIGLAVLNQAPPPRLGKEPAVVAKALAALQLTGLEVAPVAIRSRAAYQAAIMRGLGVGEVQPDGAAAGEIAALWEQAQRLLAPSPASVGAVRSGFAFARPPARVDPALLR